MSKSHAATITAEIDGERAGALMLAELELALVPSTRRALLAYARRREQWLVTNGVRSAVGAAASYVADAITDTALGEVVCPPGIPMQAHLRGVIRGRTARILDRERRMPHDSVDDPVLDEAGQQVLIEAMGSVADCSAAYMAAEQTARVVEHVGAVAADDPLVLALVRAYQGGAWTPADVSEATGMTAAEVAAARKRLDRILARMPDESSGTSLSDSGTW